MKKQAMVIAGIFLGSIFLSNDVPKASDYLEDPNLEEAIKYQLNTQEKIRVTDEQLESLSTIDASWFGVRELTGLEDASNIQSLYLEGNKLIQIKELSSLSNLSRLILRDNNIVDLSPLNQMKNLATLDVSGNQISTIQPISSLGFKGEDLTFDLSRNKITSLVPLKTAAFPTNPNFFEFNFSFNQVKSISGIENITGITHFIANDNKISSISGLKAGNLEFVNLSNNELTSIDVIKNYSPSTLLVANNKLTSLKNISFQEDKVYYMNFSRNSISDISSLSGVRTGIINLENNKIKDLSPLKGMEVGEIKLKGNPLSIKNKETINQLKGKGVKISYDTLIDDRVVSTTRLSGSSRYSTAVSISKQGFEKSDHVVIARGDSFPDALAGVPYAYKLNAPILLTNGSELPIDTIDEIKRLEAKKVTILGGEAAVSTSVERYIKNTLKLSVERIAGTNRFETAVKINEKLTPTKNQAILVYGYNFPDALSIASYAAKNGIPIYLTDKETIPSITFNSIKSYKQTIIVGGTAVITNKVADKVNKPSRIGGKNRYDTAAKIYTSLMSPYNSDHVFFGNGNGFADSLTGSVLAAKYSAPLLLVETDKLPLETSNVISKELYYGYILGGEAVITNGLASDIKKQLMEAK